MICTFSISIFFLKRLALAFWNAWPLIEPLDSSQSTPSVASSAGADLTGADVAAKLSAFELNDAQADAILSCVAAARRDGATKFSLIWGPPGTGKTKTISVLLLLLLTTSQARTICRVLTCAPTNTAISQIASRVLALTKQHAAADGGCHGDLLLFGNRERMAIGGDLSEIFLDTRVKRLKKCFSQATGWRHCLVSLAGFLGEPTTLRSQYNEACGQKDGTELPEASFIRSRFHQIFQNLRNCFRTIMSQVPKAVLLEKNYKNIVSVIKMLEDLSMLLDRKIDGNNNVVVEVFMTTSGKKCDDSAGGVGKKALVENLMRNKTAILGVTRNLLRDLKLPVTRSDFRIKKFCLRSASFVFCTVSGPAKLNAQKMDLLLIDEAGQLKECESLIPLQLSGLKHAVLIGDERQLPVGTICSPLALVIFRWLLPLLLNRSEFISCRLQRLHCWAGACLRD